MIGFWSTPVFMILSFSGVYLVFPTTVGDSIEAVLPHESTLVHSKLDAATIATIPNPDALTADDAAKLALAAVPGARLHSVQLPPGADGTYMVTLMPHYSSEGAPQISAFVGPGAEVSAVVDPRQDPMGTRVLDWMKALHFGLGLGIVGKFLFSFPGSCRCCLPSRVCACGKSGVPRSARFRTVWLPPLSEGKRPNGLN